MQTSATQAQNTGIGTPNRRDIKKGENAAVATHFNSAGHNSQGFSITAIERLTKDIHYRRAKESFPVIESYSVISAFPFVPVGDVSY